MAVREGKWFTSMEAALEFIAEHEHESNARYVRVEQRKLGKQIGYMRSFCIPDVGGRIARGRLT